MPCSRAIAAAESALIVSATAIDAGGAAVDGDDTWRSCPRPRALAAAASSVADGDASVAPSACGCRAARARPSTVASTPWPGMAAKPSGSASCRPRSLAPSTIASASGCSELRSTAAARREDARPRSNPGAAMHVGQRGLALGDRAGLVEHDRVELAAPSRAPRRSDQDAVLGALARADHDRVGVASPARTGTR